MQNRPTLLYNSFAPNVAVKENGGRQVPRLARDLGGTDAIGTDALFVVGLVTQKSTKNVAKKSSHVMHLNF
jgi:hypothetical protein